MSRTTMGWVLYFFAMDATDSPFFTVCSETRTRSSGLSSSRLRRERVGGVARQQQEVRAGRIGGPAMEAGVELVHFVERDAGEFGRERQIELAAGVDLHEVGLVRNRAERDAVVLGIRDEAAHGHQLRHVGARFRGQTAG